MSTETVMRPERRVERTRRGRRRAKQQERAARRLARQQAALERRALKRRRREGAPWPGAATDARGRGGEPPVPRSARRAALDRRRRRIRLAVLAGVTLVLVVGAALFRGVGTSPEPVPQPPPQPAPAEDGQTTFLLVRTEVPGGPARGITLFAAGVGDGPSGIVLIPAGLFAEVPGVGLDRLALAQQVGGAERTRSALENLLGLRIDAAGEVTDDELGALLDRAGPIEIDVPGRLVRRDPEGAAEVRFERGVQTPEGRRLSEFWSFRGVGETDLEAFPREQQVLEGLLQVAAEDPAALDRIVASEQPGVQTPAPDVLRDVLATLADREAAGDVPFSVLPVQSFGGVDAEGESAYRLDLDRVETAIGGVLSPSVPEGGGREAARVQVLNGVGRPGVAAQVDRFLAGGRYRIVRTENASSFDFAETMIVVYDEEPATLATAAAVRDALGVGTIRVSSQPQTVIDLTVVVGADFPLDAVALPEGDPAPAPAPSEG